MLFDAWVETMKAMFEKMGRPMVDANLRQAMLPESAEIVDNPVGTACGFKICLNGATLLFTPGVPREFKKMVHEQVLPLLQAEQDVDPITIKRFLCMGIGESTLADKLAHIELPEGCGFGFRAAMPFIELKIFCRGIQDIDEVIEQIEAVAGKYVVVRDGSSLALHVHELLMEKAETGGFKFGHGGVLHRRHGS